MLTRKNLTASNNDCSNNTINYVRDFCVQANYYKNNKSEEALVLLNRSASLLSTAIHPQYFAPRNLEISKFFIDLHTVMGTLSNDSDALWSCVTVLHHCARNLEAHKAITEEYRFLPLLTSVLKSTQTSDKIQRLLLLIQELTFGIRITWEEPYLVALLGQLVQIVYQASEKGEDVQAQLALSILINICYKNFVVLFLFLRSVNISNFSRCIKNYGMLASKMCIILSDDICVPEQNELHLFLRSSFKAIGECIGSWNVPHLRHIVEFLKDSKSHIGLHQTMLNYKHYCEDIEKLLDQLEARNSIDEANEDQRKQQQICMGLLFELIQYIMELSAQPSIGGDENSISLDSNIPRIFELLSTWLDCDLCGVNAINLLDTLVRLAKRELIAPRIARDHSLITQLITASEKQETSPLQTAAVLQLLISLLHHPKTEKLILTKITESYFDKILSPLLSVKLKMPDNSLSMAEVEKSILCLLLLINFADIAKKAYFEKCCTLLQLPQVHYALARALINGGETASIAVFKICQFEHFPQIEVAKHLSELNTSLVSCKPSSLPTDVQWYNLNAILKSQKTFMNKEFEERLQALIETITQAQRNNQLNNLTTSQIIELFNYKIEKLSNSEENMQKRLEQASEEISHLKQRLNLQNAELEKYHTMNFELHIKRESLQTQCQDLKQQQDTLKRNMNNLMKKLSEQSENLQIAEKRLAVKISEMIVLQKDYNELKTQLQIKAEELDKLQTAAKDNVLRIDKLKKTVAAYEMDIKEKARHIDEKERELAKTQKALEEQTEARKKSDDVVTVLESQLQAKNEEIRNYELELSETEELRKTIMSLMEKAFKIFGGCTRPIPCTGSMPKAVKTQVDILLGTRLQECKRIGGWDRLTSIDITPIEVLDIAVFPISVLNYL
uniref:Protein CIP2A n=1 Tax=Glossina brevipalpis TaxID=37001 RepID=A0A1A9W1T0_9MUSC